MVPSDPVANPPHRYCSHPEPFTREERIGITMAYIQAHIPDRFDASRLSAGLELAYDKPTFDAKIVQYKTTIWACACPDRAYRTGTRACKHMIAKMLECCIIGD